MKAKSIARSALNASFKSHKDSIDKCRKDLIVLKSRKEGIMDITVQVLDFLGTNERDLDKPRVSVHYYVAWDGKPKITFAYRNAPGFKDIDLEMAMSHVMGLGFDTSENYNYENAELLNREFNFTRADMHIKFDVYVKSDSPTCRKIKIGTDTVKVDKWQIECD